MASLHFRRALLKWGNAYGIRVTKNEAERLRIEAHTPIDVDVSTEPPRFDPSSWRPLRLGRDASERHGEIAAEAADARR